MPEDKRPFVTITIGRREAKLLLAAALLVAVPYLLSSETLTLSTTYPSPAGIYKKLIATGEAILGRDAGNVVLVPASNAGGSVLIGAAAPGAKLAVGGGVAASGSISSGGTIRFGNFAAGAEPAGTEGAIYYNTTKKIFRGFSDGAWKDIGAGGHVAGGLYGLCIAGSAGGGCCAGGGLCSSRDTRISCISKPGCSWTCAQDSAPNNCSTLIAPAACTGPNPHVPCACPTGYKMVTTGTTISGFQACGACTGSTVLGAGPVYSCMKQ